jgi:imidazolonepropionase-like amidohydrolase
LLILFLLSPLFAQQWQTTARRDVFAFSHVTLIDATGAPARRDMTVVVVGTRIAAIGKSGRVRIPEGARVVDATGKFLIPGLWDMHVHIGDGAFDRDSYLPLFVANGVTGVRVMTGAPEHHLWRSSVESGALLGPRMVIASGRIDEAKTGEAQAREAARRAKREGADFFKVYDDLPRASYFALVDEARRLSLPVEGHVPRSVTALEVSAAGQRSVEHFTGLDEAKFDRAKAGAVIAAFKKNGTWLCPTLIMRHNYAMLDDRSLAADTRLRYAKPSWREGWLRMSNDSAKTPAAEWAKRRELIRKEDALVGEMRHAGVGILAGTDDSNPYVIPGFSLHDELALLVAAGLTPMQALQAATLNPAKFFGRLDTLGTVETGKLADLVLLDADPLADIRNTTRINAVVVNGRLLDRKDLDGILRPRSVVILDGEPPVISSDHLNKPD